MSALVVALIVPLCIGTVSCAETWEDSESTGLWTFKNPGLVKLTSTTFLSSHCNALER